MCIETHLCFKRLVELSGLFTHHDSIPWKAPEHCVNCDRDWAALAQHYDDLVCSQKQAADAAKREIERQVLDFQQTRQGLHTGSEWDLNRPDRFLLDSPARYKFACQVVNGTALTILSLQRFVALPCPNSNVQNPCDAVRRTVTRQYGSTDMSSSSFCIL